MTARVNRETADDYIFCEGHVRGSEQNSDHKGGAKAPFFAGVRFEPTTSYRSEATFGIKGFARSND